MVDITHEDIERLWNSIIHYVPERQRHDMAIDFIKSLDKWGFKTSELNKTIIGINNLVEYHSEVDKKRLSIKSPVIKIFLFLDK